MKARVNVDLTGLNAGGAWVRAHASILSEVIDNNVTGKAVTEITVGISNGRAVAGEIKVGATEAVPDPTITLRSIAQALIMHADKLDALTIGVSEDEKQALESIAQAAS